MEHANLPSPEELGIDPFYRIAHYSIRPVSFFTDQMNRMLEDARNHPLEAELIRFVEWVVQEKKFTPLILPEIDVDGWGYDYYRLMHGILQQSRDQFCQHLPACVDEYNQLFSPSPPFEINLPDGPSHVWLEVMEPTSIAMGRMKTGPNWDRATLSPAGAIWRAQTLRSLLDSLHAVNEHPVFAALVILKPEVLADYFMSIHDILYTTSDVGFQFLPPSDAMLIANAGSSELWGEPRQVLQRAGQLLDTTLRTRPSIGYWTDNILSDIRGMWTERGCTVTDEVKEQIFKVTTGEVAYHPADFGFRINGRKSESAELG